MIFPWVRACLINDSGPHRAGATSDRNIVKRAAAKTGMVRIGISGWRYKGWRGRFYPPKLPQRRELEFASSESATIEINGTFYLLQRPENYAQWKREAPEGFVFAVKGSRYITHLPDAIKKWRDESRARAA